MKSSILFVMWWAGRSYFFLAAIWCAVMFAKSRNGNNEKIKEKMNLRGAKELMPSSPEENAANIPEVQPQGKRTVWIASMTLIAGLALGYESRDLQMRMRTNTLLNLTVESQSAPREFVILTANNDEFHTVFCEDVPFKAGTKLKELTYEDKTYCWSVKDRKLGYYFARGDENHGWNPNTNANPYTVAFTNSHTAR